MKKKPITTIKNAHHPDENSQPISQSENWVTSVRSLQSTDVIASGIVSYSGLKKYVVHVPATCKNCVILVKIIMYLSDGSVKFCNVSQKYLKVLNL